MKIVLLRHGKPDITEFGKLTAGDVHQWIESYNSAGLMGKYKPSKESVEIASSCDVVMTSDFQRSIESAKALGIEEIDFTESMFREAGLPFSCFPSPRFRPDFWVVLLRFLWFLGYSANAESVGETKLRATQGAARLRELAEEYGSVLLVGHGFINRFIAKELLSNGWQGPNSPGKQFWEFAVYEFKT